MASCRHLDMDQMCLTSDTSKMRFVSKMRSKVGLDLKGSPRRDGEGENSYNFIVGQKKHMCANCITFMAGSGVGKKPHLLFQGWSPLKSRPTVIF